MAESEEGTRNLNPATYIRTGSSISYMFDTLDDEDGNTERKALLEESNNIHRRGHVIDNEIMPTPHYGSVQQPERKSNSVSSEFRNGQDELWLLQAQVFLEDSSKYRNINHKVDYESLKLYRFYHSTVFSICRYLVIIVLHGLAFFEFPSSFSWTSDIRTRSPRLVLPCGVTEGIELFCLIFLTGDAFIKSRIYGYQHLRRNKWLILEIVILFASYIDWAVSVMFGCGEVVRVRRMIRPVFIIQNSSLMKKILNCLRKTIPQVLGVLMLMALHLYIFTLFGMLLFPKPKGTGGTHTNVDGYMIGITFTNITGANSTQGNEAAYFRTLTESFMNLLVLLTTANNPDVTLPAYRRNRLYAIFFIIFLIIGLYCFMNMLTAIIYNQFRGYFQNSLQSSLMRRRLGQRAAFESLRKRSLQLGSSFMEEEDTELNINKVSVRDLQQVVSKSTITREQKIILMEAIAEGYTQKQALSWNQFLGVMQMMEKNTDKKEKPSVRWFQNHRRLLTLQKVVCSRYFGYFANFMAFLNVVLITVELATEYDKSLSSSKSALRIINFLFILYYLVEQTLIFVCLGWRRYTYSYSNVYDCCIVIILLCSELIAVALYGFPFFTNKETHGNLALWNIVRLINILIMFRLLRVIWHIKTMAIVAHTLLDLIRNLKSFGGILVVIYYFFAMLGMELFQDKIKFTNSTDSTICGTYEQLDYWANNFDDFAAAIVVLWDVMVVNNWFVFLDAYAKYTSQWSYLYFIAWWLISVVLALNLFTALILENFIMKWDRFSEQSGSDTRARSGSLSSHFIMDTLTVHDMFRPNLKEPTEQEILHELCKIKQIDLHSNT